MLPTSCVAPVSHLSVMMLRTDPVPVVSPVKPISQKKARKAFNDLIKQFEQSQAEYRRSGYGPMVVLAREKYKKVLQSIHDSLTILMDQGITSKLQVAIRQFMHGTLNYELLVKMKSR